MKSPPPHFPAVSKQASFNADTLPVKGDKRDF